MQIVTLLAHFNRSRYNDLQYISILRPYRTVFNTN